MVVPPPAALVLQVRHTLIRTPGVVVVVGHLLGSRFGFPAVVRWNHPVDFDVVAYLNGDDHGEPACAQPRVRFLSIPPGLPVKQAVKPAHLAGCDAEAGHVAVGHADSLDQPVQRAFGLLPDLARGSPEDDHGVAVRPLEELAGPPDHPEHAGVGHDPQRGLVPHVGLVARRRRVVHPDHALRAVDLFSRSTAQHVAGARHQRTPLTV